MIDSREFLELLAFYSLFNERAEAAAKGRRKVNPFEMYGKTK